MLVLIDGNYLLHRCMRVGGLGSLSTSYNIPIGGVFGFIKSVRSSLWSVGATSCIVVFDGGISERRRQIYPAYKGSKYRSKEDPLYEEQVDEDRIRYAESFSTQRKILQDRFLRYMGIPSIRVIGFEADDIIYHLSRRGANCVIASDDRDYLQAVSETCQVIRPIAQERITTQSFADEVGYPQDQFFIRKAILGDGSDNIPGIYDVGKGTVNKLLSSFDGDPSYPFEEFFLECVENGSKRALRIASDDGVSTVLRNYRLIDLSLEEITHTTHLSISEKLHNVCPFDIVAVRELLLKYEMVSLVKEYHSWILPFQKLHNTVTK